MIERLGGSIQPDGGRLAKRKGVIAMQDLKEA
jgi:hypothetical protein